MAFALPTTAEACRDRMRDLLDESRVLAAEIERITSAHVTGSVPAVMDTVCARWGVTHADLVGREKVHHLVEARYTAWLLLSEMQGVNPSAIGRTFSGRYASTVAFGIKHITAWAAADRKLAAKVTACRAALSVPAH